MTAAHPLDYRTVRCRKMTFRGHGAMVSGTANDMPPPPNLGYS